MPSTATANVIYGAVAIPSVVVLIVAIALSGMGMSFSFGDFGLHPVLMCIAFGLCGTIASPSYRIFEGLLGWSHQRAKLTHAALHAAALFIGTVGVASMWVTHANAPHFQSLHSWIGGFALVLYYCQFGAGAYYFFVSTDASTKASFLPLHRFLGSCLTVLCLLTIVTGVLSLVYRGKPVGTFSSDQTLLNLAALLLIPGAVLFAAALHPGLNPGPGTAAAFPDAEQSQGLIEADDPHRGRTD